MSVRTVIINKQNNYKIKWLAGKIKRKALRNKYVGYYYYYLRLLHISYWSQSNFVKPNTFSQSHKRKHFISLWHLLPCWWRDVAILLNLYNPVLVRIYKFKLRVIRLSMLIHFFLTEEFQRVRILLFIQWLTRSLDVNVNFDRAQLRSIQSNYFKWTKVLWQQIISL